MIDRVTALLAPALLAAFVVTSVFAGDRELALDARAVGLAAAAVALLLRAPILVVVIVAALATALVRALGYAESDTPQPSLRHRSVRIDPKLQTVTQ